MIYLFDVDGTLTPSRGVMDPDFKQFFKSLPNYSLVTGSDKPKTIEQVGEDVFAGAEYSFNCSGNDVYKQGKHLYKSDWQPSKYLINFLEQCLETSTYTERYGNHIEVRTGMVNFSVVGRNAVGDQRTKYFKWDQTIGERRRIASVLKMQFPELAAEVGGETGIDIYPEGLDKSQVIQYFPDADIHFFGDRCEAGGNDHSLAIKLDRVSHVKNWKETWNILERALKYTNPQMAVTQ